MSDPTPFTPPATTNLVPSLQQIVRVAGLDAEKLCVAFEANSQKQVRILDQHDLCVSDGKKMARWKVASLTELFRGNRQPPPDMDHYPEDYAPLFFFIERQFLTLCDALGDRTDQEMEEIYSALRRRPDGRSLGMVHDFLWQISALLLGRYPLNQTEFEALIGALVRSTRKWSERPVSRNYIDYLRQTFGQAHSSSIVPQ